MKICIIGGSGFIGSRLIESLKVNHQLLNIDKQQSPFFSDITVIADIRDIENLYINLRGQDYVILLAAEHRDDVTPTSLYYDVNVEGTRNVIKAMDECGIQNILFTSSVAVYGLNKENPSEDHPIDPFNHYGKSKWQAEQILKEWYAKDSQRRTLSIIRPTVVFGERNRGNVYNLLKQIASGYFFRVGSCNNTKSMAYVGNVVEFMAFLIKNVQGFNIYNYVDKPDLSTNELIGIVSKTLDKKIPSIKIPFFLGMLGGYIFDILACLIRKKLSISSVRVRKFCATTQYDATKVGSLDFIPPYSLSEGLERTINFEFLNKEKDNIIFISE